MDPRSLLPAAFVLLASVLGAAGQYVFQAAASRMRPGLLGFLLEPRVLLGMGCYVGVMALYTRAFRLGGTVAELYPIYATTFVWAALWARFARDEVLRAPQVLGLVLVVCGVALCGFGRGN